MSDWIPLVGASISGAGAMGALGSVFLARRRIAEDEKRKRQLARLTSDTHRALLRLQQQEGLLQTETAAAMKLILQMYADAESTGTIDKGRHQNLLKIMTRMQTEVAGLNQSTADLDDNVVGT